MYQICLKLTMKTPERRQCRTRTLWFPYCQFSTVLRHSSGISIVEFEQVNAGWGSLQYSNFLCFYLRYDKK